MTKERKLEVEKDSSYWGDEESSLCLSLAIKFLKLKLYYLEIFKG